MTVLLLVGYIPLTLLVVGLGVFAAGLRRDTEAARALGDQLGRRSGVDRRSGAALAFVGADRRSGTDRRAAAEARDERAA